VTSLQRAKRLDREVFKHGLVLLGVDSKAQIPAAAAGGGSIPISKRMAMNNFPEFYENFSCNF